MRRPRALITILTLLAAGGLLWILGAYLESIYGLDPPYIWFWSGFWIQIAGVLFLIAAPIAALIQCLMSRRAPRETVKL